nr:unnamed protein product [Spirometra erinaceieuropaei]
MGDNPSEPSTSLSHSACSTGPSVGSQETSSWQDGKGKRHNGSIEPQTTPVDLLRPSADKATGNRKKEPLDLQHCVVVQGLSESDAPTPKERISADLNMLQHLLNEMLNSNEKITIRAAFRIGKKTELLNQLHRQLAARILEMSFQLHTDRMKILRAPVFVCGRPVVGLPFVVDVFTGSDKSEPIDDFLDHCASEIKGLLNYGPDDGSLRQSEGQPSGTGDGDGDARTDALPGWTSVLSARPASQRSSRWYGVKNRSPEVTGIRLSFSATSVRRTDNFVTVTEISGFSTSPMTSTATWRKDYIQEANVTSDDTAEQPI